jgi:hypothetical protein
MGNSEQEIWLEAEIQRIIVVFQKDRERHKRGALAVKIVVVSLPGLTTCLLGWKGRFPLRWRAFCLISHWPFLRR